MNLEQEAREYFRTHTIKGDRLDYLVNSDLCIQQMASFARQQLEARDRQIERYRAALERARIFIAATECAPIITQEDREGLKLHCRNAVTEIDTALKDSD